jgi:hypothetical protein
VTFNFFSGQYHQKKTIIFLSFDFKEATLVTDNTSDYQSPIDDYLLEVSKYSKAVMELMTKWLIN